MSLLPGVTICQCIGLSHRPCVHVKCNKGVLISFRNIELGPKWKEGNNSVTFSFTNCQQTMGKGKRAHTISTPSIPSFGLPTTSDISFSVSPIRLKPLSKSQAQTSPRQETPSAPLPSPRYHDQEQPTRRYEDIQHKMESAPLSILVCTYLNYFVIILLGHLRDICGKIFKPNEYCHLRTTQVRFWVCSP